MRVAVYYNNSDIRVEEYPRPEIGPGELLLRVKASGICGSDVMEWYRLRKAPLVLGHEVAGVVEEAGPGVEPFAPGDRIVTTHHVPCDRCHYCLTDRHAVCRTLHSTNFEPGGFAEFVRLPAINVEKGTFKLPDNVSFEEGTFVEPLACVIRGQRLAGFRPGDNVIVLGSGISGILQIQLARAEKAGKVLATDVTESRLKAARRFGADEALVPGPDLVERVRELHEGRLPERVFVCTASKRAMKQALELVDDGGSVLFFAPLTPGDTLPLPVNELWKRGATLVHSYAGPPAEMRAALDLLASRKIDAGAMITHRFGLADTDRGFRLVAEAGNSLKVIIEPEH